MEKLIRNLILAAWFAVIPHAAQAQAYLIEIGHPATEETALEQWQQLANRYPVLSDLEFFPVSGMNNAKNAVMTRIQAGIFPAKQDAYRVCGELYKHGIPCLIIEKTKEIRPRTAAQQQSGHVVLPWLQKDSPPMEPKQLSFNDDEGDSLSLFSWLWGDSDEAHAATSETVSVARKGDVQVAEAIRVPLSDSGAQSPHVRFSEGERGQSDNPFSASRNAASGWLVISAFANENEASAMWQSLRNENPDRTAGLRARIMRPLMQSARQGISLYVGSFESNRAAALFCKNRIQPGYAGLSCQFMRDDDVSPSGRYEKRRQQAQAEPEYGVRRSVNDNRKPPKIYWLQVAAAETQPQAMEAWNGLKNRHADLLEGLRGNISASLSREKRYMVRVGPLESGAAALELCSMLAERGVSCRVYSNM